MNDRVSLSRSSVPRDVEWSVYLEDAESTSEARIVDVRPVEIALAFDGWRAPRLRIAERVTLSLVGESSQKRVDCRVTGQCRHDDETVIYELKLDGHSRIDFTEFLCERQDVRVRPDPSMPIEVLLSVGDGDGVRTGLYDISCSGIAVLVRMDDEERLYRADSVVCRLVLPTDARSLEITGLVRNRQLLGATIRYGIEFAFGGRDQELQEPVRVYVMRRQVEIIRQTKKWSP